MFSRKTYVSVAVGRYDSAIYREGLGKHLQRLEAILKMPKQKFDAVEPEEAEEVIGQTLIADD